MREKARLNGFADRDPRVRRMNFLAPCPSSLKANVACTAEIVWTVAEKVIKFLSGGVMIAVLTGCSMTQLQERTIDIGHSVGAIYTSQVLENLHSLLEDRNAMPSHFSIKDGSINTSESIKPSITIPLGNAVTRTAAAGGVSQVVGSYNSVSLDYGASWTQSWNIEPEKDPVALQRLRFLYLFVLGRQPVNGTTARDLFDREMAEVMHVSQLAESIIGRCSSPQATMPCFRVRQHNDGCVQPAKSTESGRDWICLGKYQSIREKMTNKSEMMISGEAYWRNVLFDLVRMSLRGPPPTKDGKPKS